MNYVDNFRVCGKNCSFKSCCMVEWKQTWMCMRWIMANTQMWTIHSHRLNTCITTREWLQILMTDMSQTLWVFGHRSKEIILYVCTPYGQLSTRCTYFLYVLTWVEYSETTRMCRMQNFFKNFFDAPTLSQRPYTCHLPHAHLSLFPLLHKILLF